MTTSKNQDESYHLLSKLQHFVYPIFVENEAQDRIAVKIFDSVNQENFIWSYNDLIPL